jgi:hypothetical protein
MKERSIREQQRLREEQVWKELRKRTLKFSPLMPDVEIKEGEPAGVQIKVEANGM